MPSLLANPSSLRATHKNAWQSRVPNTDDSHELMYDVHNFHWTEAAPSE